MIDPRKFYSSDDEPTHFEHEEVWSRLHRTRREERNRPAVFILDRRSFLFGAAAMLAFTLVVEGAYLVGQRVADTMRSPEGKLNRAYERALDEFDRALPVVNRVASEGEAAEGDLLALRWKQVEILDGSIENVRSMLRLEPENKNLRLELLQLYNLKIQFVLQVKTSAPASVTE